MGNWVNVAASNALNADEEERSASRAMNGGDFHEAQLRIHSVRVAAMLAKIFHARGGCTREARGRSGKRSVERRRSR